jgi:hypothetical protein
MYERTITLKFWTEAKNDRRANDTHDWSDVGKRGKVDKTREWDLGRAHVRGDCSRQTPVQ